MEKYTVCKFDGHTFIVMDEHQKREICVCQNYCDYEDAELRAKKIASLLNRGSSEVDLN